MSSENEICEPDDACTVDPSSITGSEESSGGVLILVFKGSYLTWDASDSAVELAKAVLAVGKRSTLFLKGNGVLMASMGQEPEEHDSLESKILEVLDFGGRVLVSEQSLREKGLDEEDLIKEVKVVEESVLYKEMLSHDEVLTF